MLKEIIEAAQRVRIALLCYEADPQECHRSILLEEIAARCDDLEVVAL